MGGRDREKEREGMRDREREREIAIDSVIRGGGAGGF